MKNFKVSILLLGSFFVFCVNAHLEELFRWKQLAYEDYQPTDFLFPEQTDNGGLYVAYNNVPMGVTHYKGRLFITVPRRRPGIPATLNYINLKSAAQIKSPLLHGYPDYETNAVHPNFEYDSNRIISVYRTQVDACRRLWFVDTGMLEYPGNYTQVQRPSIWVINLENDSLLHRFEIPEGIVARGNGLPSITVDVEKGKCDDAYAYVPDLANYHLYVYSLRENHMWTYVHNYFHFDPHYGDFTIGGVSFQWDDGIFSITLGSKNPNGYRTAYFHPMASVSEFAVSTEILRNETLSQRSYHNKDFKFLGKRGEKAQSTMHDYDETTGIIFFANIALNGISCYNTAKPFKPENIPLIAYDDKKMIYPGDLNVDKDGTLWVMTNTMPRFIYASLNPNEYNFRVWRSSTVAAVENTACAL